MSIVWILFRFATGIEKEKLLLDVKSISLGLSGSSLFVAASVINAYVCTLLKSIILVCKMVKPLYVSIRKDPSLIIKVKSNDSSPESTTVVSRRCPPPAARPSSTSGCEARMY